jgi:hypothetical protein
MSLKILSQVINYDKDTLNAGIGGAASLDVRLNVVSTNTQIWKIMAIKNNAEPFHPNLLLGIYNSNSYIASIDKNTETFKDLYINNIGIATEPGNYIGNVVMNGKLTIGNSSNNNTYTHMLDVVNKNNTNIAIFRSSNNYLSISS